MNEDGKEGIERRLNCECLFNPFRVVPAPSHKSKLHVFFLFIVRNYIAK